MPYEVQMYTSHRTWKNACAATDGDGIIRDRPFATRDEAELALCELLADIEADKADGFWPPWTRDDFRVTRVPDNGRERYHISEGATP